MPYQELLEGTLRLSSSQNSQLIEQAYKGMLSLVSKACSLGKLLSPRVTYSHVLKKPVLVYNTSGSFVLSHPNIGALMTNLFVASALGQLHR